MSRTMRRGCIRGPDSILIFARRPMRNFTWEPPTSITRMRAAEGAFPAADELRCLLDLPTAIAPHCTGAERSAGDAAAEQAGRQHHDCPQQGEHAVERDPCHAEWNRQQPDDWPQDQRQDCQRPAHHQQQEPQEKLDHRLSILFVMFVAYTNLRLSFAALALCLALNGN